MRKVAVGRLVRVPKGVSAIRKNKNGTVDVFFSKKRNPKKKRAVKRKATKKRKPAKKKTAKRKTTRRR